jgi:hypothetical protein
MVWLFRPSSPPSRVETAAAEAPQIVVAASSEQVETLLSVPQFSPANTAAVAAAEAAPAVDPPEAVPLTPAIETVLKSPLALPRPAPRRFRLNTSLFRKPPPSTPPPKNRQRSLPPQQKASVSKVRRSKGHASSPRQQRRRHSEAARLATSLAATTSPAKLAFAHNEFQIVRSGSMSSFNSNWNVGDDNDSALYNSQDGSVGDGSSINVPLSTQSCVSLGTNSTRSTLPVDNTHNSLSVPPRLLHNFGQQVPPSLLTVTSPDSTTNQSIFSRAALTREDTLVDVFSIVASSSLLTSSSVSDHEDDDDNRFRSSLPRQYQKKPLLDVVVDDSLNVSSDYSQDDPASNNNHSSLEAGLFEEFKAEPTDDLHLPPPPLTASSSTEAQPVEELVGVGLSPIEKRPSPPVAEEDDDEDEDAAAYITVPCRMRWVTTPPSSPAAAAALRSDGSLSSMSMSPPNAKSLDVPLSSPDSSDLVVFESRSSSSAMSPPRLLEPVPPPTISRQAEAAEDNATVDVKHSPGQVLAAATREPTTSMVHKYQQFQAQASVPSMKKSLSPTAAPGPALATTSTTTTLPTLQIVGLAAPGRHAKAQVVPFSVEEAMKKVIKKPGQRLLRSYYQAKMMLLDESETDATEEMTESARQADSYPIQEVPAAPPADSPVPARPADLHQTVASLARQRLPSKLPAPGSPGTRKLAVRALLSTAQSPTRIPIPKSFRPSARPLGDSEPASERVVSKVSKPDSVQSATVKIVSEADPYLLYYQKWYEKGLIPWSPAARPAAAAAGTTTPSAHPIPGRTTAWLHHVRSATWKSVDLQPLNDQVDDNDTVQSSVVASVASPTKNEPSSPAEVEPVVTELENDTVERVVVASPAKNEPSPLPQPLEEEPEVAKVESATEPLQLRPGNQVELQEKIASEPLDQMELQEGPKVESVEQAASVRSPDGFDEILEQILDPRESDTEEKSQDSVQVKGLLVQTTQFPEAVSPLASPLAPDANSMLLRQLLQSGSPPEEPLRDEAANNANKEVEDDSIQQTDKGRQGKPGKYTKKKSGIKGFFNRLLVKNKKTEGAPVRTKERKVRRSAGNVSSSVTNSDLSKPNGSVRDVETGVQTIDSSASGDTGSGGNATGAVSGVDPVSAGDVPPLGGPQPIPSVEDDLDSERFPSPIMSDGHEDSVDYDVVSLAESSEISEETRGADSSVKQTDESNPNLFDRLHHPSAPPVDDREAEEKGYEEIDLDQGDEEVAERIAALVAAAESLICEIDAGRLAPVIPKVHRGAPVLSWFGHAHSLIPADSSLYLAAPAPEVPASSSGRALVKSLSEPPISTAAVPELNLLASDSWKSLPSPTTLPKTDESPAHLSSASRVSEYQRFVEAHKKRVQDRRKSKSTGEGETLASF